MTKKILFIILVITFVSAVATEVAPVWAEGKPLEIIYPEIPSIPAAQTPTTIKTLLPDYIKYVIVFGMVFSGLIIFGSLLFAGFLYMTSSGNPAALGNSKSRMLSAFLGMIILLSSYLTLNTINPTLIELKVDPKASTKGVVFRGDGDKEYETMMNVANFDDTPVSSPLTIRFPLQGKVEVIPCNIENDFSDENCPLDGTITENGSWPGGKAARLVWKTPGVYLYDDTEYGGEVRLYNTSQGSLGNFSDKAESIKILHPSDQEKFGVILHFDEGFSNECKFIFDQYGVVEELRDLSNFNNEVSSLTVFKYKIDFGYSGGVEFYKQPNYQDTAGYYTNGNADWTNLSADNNNNIYSIKIDGKYLVAIAKGINGDGNRCEVFTNSDSDLSDNPIGQCIHLGQCSPECWGFDPYFCPVCTGSCASSFIVIPLLRW